MISIDDLTRDLPPTCPPDASKERSLWVTKVKEKLEQHAPRQHEPWARNAAVVLLRLLADKLQNTDGIYWVRLVNETNPWSDMTTWLQNVHNDGKPFPTGGEFFSALAETAERFEPPPQIVDGKVWRKVGAHAFWRKDGVLVTRRGSRKYNVFFPTGLLGRTPVHEDYDASASEVMQALDEAWPVRSRKRRRRAKPISEITER